MSDNMLNRDGWIAVSCAESDAIRSQSSGVRSSLPDPEGVTSGMTVVYTEWEAPGGGPLLRDYRWSGDEPCEHLVPAVDRP